MKVSDIDLFNLVCTDDHQAFEQLFRKYYKVLCSFALTIGHDSLIAEEVVQEVFLNIWERRKSIHLNKSLKAYLYTAVHNAVVNHKKKKSKHLEILVGSFLNELADEQNMELPEKNMESELKKLEAAIDLLPPRCAKVFALCKLQGKKQLEVAAMLGISIKTVEAQIAKAKKLILTSIKG